MIKLTSRPIRLSLLRPFSSNLPKSELKKKLLTEDDWFDTETIQDFGIKMAEQLRKEKGEEMTKSEHEEAMVELKRSGE